QVFGVLRQHVLVELQFLGGGCIIRGGLRRGRGSSRRRRRLLRAGGHQHGRRDGKGDWKQAIGETVGRRVHDSQYSHRVRPPAGPVRAADYPKRGQASVNTVLACCFSNVTLTVRPIARVRWTVPAGRTAYCHSVNSMVPAPARSICSFPAATRNSSSESGWQCQRYSPSNTASRRHSPLTLDSTSFR